MKKAGIIIHCSASKFGSSIEIDKWHREKGWNNVGYNFVICNGQVESNTYLACMNGAIERGRDIDKSGAHAKGYNDHIGICLIGEDTFTANQFDALHILIKELMPKYGINLNNIIGHNQVSTKTCPNFDVIKWVADTIYPGAY